MLKQTHMQCIKKSAAQRLNRPIQFPKLKPNGRSLICERPRLMFPANKFIYTSRVRYLPTIKRFTLQWALYNLWQPSPHSSHRPRYINRDAKWSNLHISLTLFLPNVYVIHPFHISPVYFILLKRLLERSREHTSTRASTAFARVQQPRVGPHEYPSIISPHVWARGPV